MLNPTCHKNLLKIVIRCVRCIAKNGIRMASCKCKKQQKTNGTDMNETKLSQLTIGMPPTTLDSQPPALPTINPKASEFWVIFFYLGPSVVKT
jgi:hypothetical protein